MRKFTQRELRRALHDITGNSDLMAPYEEELRVVLDAATEHADTMPIEIDVWDVEWSSKMNDSWWPNIMRYPSLAGAEAFIEAVRKGTTEVSEPVIIKRTAEVPRE